MKGKRPRQKRQQRQWISHKVEIDGIEFDSATEAAYYKQLKRDPDVLDIECHPKFNILPAYEVECKKCKGAGRILNNRTLNLNKCAQCKGKGSRQKAGSVYTADFKVTYQDGYTEYIDVKGGPVNEGFPLRKKLFEVLKGVELIVVEKKNNQFVRK
ncbi:DUF1064 domain-containing protein [Jeotgalibacillus haloalkalitolerans]|uniref:DUF1064 domain-containing protein n=1 Tax=Jeotgalibacillus haloalkalitolerans TaxID=3104292 RepID=A0ABU5KK53_9BACL|nr:DUF1064 domain-containing protein [Jeotgalibacillus sp. HH7-29]MDZ5711637.1 DUF1064 domain-containing protein [Jeotgalibacillus sp. HH7-29]